MIAKVYPACCSARRGITTVPATCCPRLATTTRPTIAATALVFVLCWPLVPPATFDGCLTSLVNRLRKFLESLRRSGLSWCTTAS